MILTTTIPTPLNIVFNLYVVFFCKVFRDSTAHDGCYHFVCISGNTLQSIMHLIRDSKNDFLRHDISHLTNDTI